MTPLVIAYFCNNNTVYSILHDYGLFQDRLAHVLSYRNPTLLTVSNISIVAPRRVCPRHDLPQPYVVNGIPHLLVVSIRVCEWHVLPQPYVVNGIPNVYWSFQKGLYLTVTQRC